MLWERLEAVMIDQHRLDNGDDDRKTIDFKKQTKYNIVDITFARKDTDDVNLLYKMNLLRIQKEKERSKLKAASEKKKDKLVQKSEKVIADLTSKYDKLLDEYMVKYSQFA